MKKITKREALDACVDIWTELARTGADEKPERAYLYELECPACEYVEQHNLDCPECVIDWRSEGGHCTDPLSPYMDWHQAKTTTERKAAAQAVLNLVKKALEDLEK